MKHIKMTPPKRYQPAPHPGCYYPPPHGYRYHPGMHPHPAYPSGYPYHYYQTAPPPPPPPPPSSGSSQPPKSSPRKMEAEKVVSQPTTVEKKNQEPIVHHNNDILMGRGGHNNSHVGNEKLREMARDLTEVYKKASKKEKSRMAWDWIEQVKELKPPGRFLKRHPDTGAWEEVSIQAAREKAGQCLRDAVAQERQGGSSAGSAEADRSIPPALVSSSSTPSTTRPSTPVSLDKKKANVIEESPLSVVPACSRRRSSVSFCFKMEDEPMDTSSSSAKRQRLGTWDNKVMGQRGGTSWDQDGSNRSCDEFMRQRLGTWEQEAANLALHHASISSMADQNHHVIPMDESVLLVDIDEQTGAHTVMLGNELEEWLAEGLNMKQERYDQPVRMYTEDEDVFYSEFF